MPAPETVIFAGEFVALLVTVTAPLSVSVFVGEKVTFKVPDCPGAIVAPLMPPPVVRSAPEALMAETDTLEFPVFSSFTARVSDFPVVTLPKFRLVGVAERVRVSATPVAVMDTVTLPDTLFVNVTLPVVEPVAVGEKLSVQLTACPAARLSG